MTAFENAQGLSPTTPITRRHFLAGTGASVLAFTVRKPGLAGGAEANSKIDIGLIGCGDHGKWIANLFQKHGGYNLVAVVLARTRGRRCRHRRCGWNLRPGRPVARVRPGVMQTRLRR